MKVFFFFLKDQEVWFFSEEGCWLSELRLGKNSNISFTIKTIVQAYLPATSGSSDVTLTVAIPLRIAREHPKA